MALRPASRTLSSLTGIVVLAAVLWLLLNFVYAPSCGKFGCSYEPYWAAHAAPDSGDGCPDSLAGAATDARWAADRITTISDPDVKVTTGLAYDQDGEPHRVVSGQDADAAEISVMLRDLGVAADPTGRYPAATHAEAKVALWMRKGNVRTVVMVINNQRGVCAGTAQNCDAIVPALLPQGATLYVWSPGRDTPVKFTGGS